VVRPIAQERYLSSEAEHSFHGDGSGPERRAGRAELEDDVAG
jgi:hypothetical protein